LSGCKLLYHNQDQDKIEMFIQMDNTLIARMLAEKVFKVFH